jgi:hypothetical protein
MTFKHDYKSSEVLRSFEKVAIQKGLIKPDAIEKIASKQIDYSPSFNLTEDILKLCQGLRTQGMVKVANELETNFLNYKQAQTLYDTHNEKGDDVVNQAHPKGSHKLEGVNSEEAVIEDILDQHIKSLKAVNKMPTGKLSSASLINKVKLALGGSSEDIQSLIASANNDLSKVYQLAVKSGGLTDQVSSLIRDNMSYSNALNDQPANDISLDAVQEAMERIDKIYYLLKPDLLHNLLPKFLTKGISTDALWNVVSPLIDNAKSKLQSAITKLAQFQASKIDAPINQSTNTALLHRGTELISRLSALKSNVAKNQIATNWIATTLPKIETAMQSNSEIDMSKLEEFVKDFEAWVAKQPRA